MKAIAHAPINYEGPLDEINRCAAEALGNLARLAIQNLQTGIVTKQAYDMQVSLDVEAVVGIILPALVGEPAAREKLRRAARVVANRKASPNAGDSERFVRVALQVQHAVQVTNGRRAETEALAVQFNTSTTYVEGLIASWGKRTTHSKRSVAGIVTALFKVAGQRVQLATVQRALERAGIRNAPASLVRKDGSYFGRSFGATPRRLTFAPHVSDAFEHAGAILEPHH
jgi:hypothetical protein